MLGYWIDRPAQEAVHWVCWRLPTILDKSIAQAGALVIQNQHRVDHACQAAVFAVTIGPIHTPLTDVFTEKPHSDELSWVYC